MMNHPNRHRGSSLIYALIAMAAMIAVLSLGVDLGRVQLAKTELRGAADAAARYAATGLSDGTATSRAISSAAENGVDGTKLVIKDGEYVDLTGKVVTSDRSKDMYLVPDSTKNKK